MKNVVYDLDGTLIKFNTFKVWIIICFFISLFCLRISFVRNFFFFVYLRRIKKLDRLGFKASLLSLQINTPFWIKLGKLYGYFLAEFCIRKDLLSIHGDARRCLATAAPDIYVVPFANKLDIFDCVIFSYFENDFSYVETLNENKKLFVVSKFSTAPDVIFTDHHDDMPLINICHFSYLVSPNEISRKIFMKELDDGVYKIIK